MIYVISDIHGCYDEYIKLLERINLRDCDTLYILGDVVDRGPQPIKVLNDMMMRPNVYPIIGNHDYVAVLLLKKLCVEVTEDNAESHLSEKDLEDYVRWINDGGQTTIDEFLALSADEREDILDYLGEFSIYEEIEVNDKEFVLVHAGLNDFDEEKDWEDYNLADLLFYRADYTRKYFSAPNKFLVTGHTPAPRMRDDKKPLVYEENGHIAIDCGCVYGGNLAAYCLDTGEVFYVNRVAEN